MMDTLKIVVPCYNEEEVLPETSKRLRQKLEDLIAQGTVTPQSRILLVNDGSKDRTWELICGLHQECELFEGIKLAHNRGHQNALLAGLMTAKESADVTISMDADLQDDINAIDRFLEEYYNGCDIVYGVRNSRETDTFFKRTTAQGFYKLMSFMGADVVYNHADYRLMSRRALEGLSQFGEVNMFLRGIVPMIGYKTATVEYSRGERFAGESKYPLSKMLNFAMDGITSLSVRPIRFITLLGFLLFSISILMLLYFLIRHFTGHTVAGWTSIVVSVWAIGGLQLLAIGVIGEYLGKIYLETKHRPKFIIETYLRH
ncbi:MAG: glycosyltransferase family 2 protein [Angelakisella sp.]|nr:glycosyltransferase family 2 protein [Angelakisella sp.]